MREHPTPKELFQPSIDLGLIVFGSFEGSMGYQPIYTKSREMYGSVEYMDLVCKYAEPIVEKVKPDAIAGAATAGTPLAMALARHFKLPFINVRKEPKERGFGQIVEGMYKKGWNVLLADDAMGDGKGKAHAVKSLREEGLVCENVLLMLDAGRELHSTLKKLNPQYHSLVVVTSLIDEMLEKKMISEELHKLIRNGFAEADLWKTGNPVRWHRYKELVEQSDLPFYEVAPMPEKTRV